MNVPSVTLPASKLAAPVEANPTPEPPAPAAESVAAPAAKEEAKPATQPAPKAKAQPTAKTSTTTQPKPAEETKKDDSKVGSILKKTG
ncbi:hypothetical protein NL446_26335, partial [Klebsiella pneumoniae]|nr:hypothetical protein [Klebsiella pneumoniae]